MATPIQKAIELAKEGDSVASRPNWWWQQKLNELIMGEKIVIEASHMKGQRSAGVDPSYSEALAHYKSVCDE